MNLRAHLVHLACITALTVLSACGSHDGLVSVTLTRAPGSHVLDGVQTLRMTVTSTMEVHTAHRSSTGGFEISLALDATGGTTALLVDGLDANDSVIAAGASPTFPLGPLSGKIAIYMAAPNSVATAPIALEPARSELGVGTLTYGALLAGGRLATGAPSDALSIYNAFDHSLVAGLALPAPRAGVVTAVGANGIAYLFGGTDATEMATDNLWRFDTTVAPAGQFSDFGQKTGFARAGERAVAIGDEHFLITGMPVADMFGLGGTLAAKNIAELPPAATSLLGTDGVVSAIFAGPGGVVRYHAGTFQTLDLPSAARAGVSVSALPGGQAAIVCGAGDLVRIDVATLTSQTFSIPAEPRASGCAVAATSKYLVIAGGTHPDSTVSSTAEVYDATTLALVSTQQLAVPRTDAQAVVLPNGQVLIVGGTDAVGAPIATIELFTPAN